MPQSKSSAAVGRRRGTDLHTKDLVALLAVKCCHCVLAQLAFLGLGCHPWEMPLCTEEGGDGSGDKKESSSAMSRAVQTAKKKSGILSSTP